MADGLLGGLLGYGNRLRSNLRGLLGDPVTYANEALGNALPSMEELAAQARQMGQTGQVPANVDPRIMDLGMGLLGAIKVYHGSPHAFTKASSEHIGKGEGAQAYGHGLYWAENPGVAEGYAKKLSSTFDQEADKRTANILTYKGKQVDLRKSFADTTPDELAVYYVHSNGGKFGAKQALKEWIDAPYTDAVAKKKYQDALDLISADKIAAADIREQWGNLYEASLRWPDAAREAADPLGPQHFLDWDKPLSEQGHNVQKALEFWKPRNVYEIVQREPYFKKAQFMIAHKDTGSGVNFFETRKEAEKYLQKMIEDGSIGSVVYNSLGRDASNTLKKAGIPGITYLDAGSRAAGQGTRNYVTFDDALIELLKRNGISLAGQ